MSIHTQHSHLQLALASDYMSQSQTFLGHSLCYREKVDLLCLRQNHPFSTGNIFPHLFAKLKVHFWNKHFICSWNSASFTQLQWNVLGYRNLLQVLNGVSLLPSCLARNSPRKGPQYPLTTACNHVFSPHPAKLHNAIWHFWPFPICQKSALSRLKT